MTDTITPTLIQVDPGALIVATNVRKDANLTKDFISSIKQHGVIQPITVYPGDEPGVYQVHVGQRRTLAAVEAGLTSIPALLVSKDVADAQLRIVEQFVENEHRAPISSSERTAVFEQLSLFGMPATQIAKRTNTRIADVGNAITVAKSPAASKALQTFETTRQLTIEHALAFAEFEDDPEVVAELTKTLETNAGQFTHRAQQLRDQRAQQAARQVVIDEIAERGLTLATDDVISRYSGRIRPIDSVWTDKKHSEQITLELALTEAADDLYAFVQVVRNDYPAPATYEVGYALANWSNHGWFAREESSSGSSKGPLSQEEKDARALQRINGPLWISATTVRLEWVKALLSRRTLPTDYAALVALHLASFPGSYHEREQKTAHELLGVEQPKGWMGNGLPEFLLSSPVQAPHLLVAIAIASFEGALDEKKGWLTTYNGRTTALYLQQLASWGYGLSELEEAIVTKHAAEVEA